MLITDFHLPNGKTGSDVINCVGNGLGESLPVFMLSGDRTAEIEDRSHDVYMRFLSKPIVPESLVAQVQELLARRAASRTAD